MGGLGVAVLVNVEVAVGGTFVGVAAGGTDVAVGGAGVTVEGTDVVVGSTDVAVGGTDVSVEGRGVADKDSVSVGSGTCVRCSGVSCRPLFLVG